MRAPDASIEIRRDLRPGQRVLEHADVMLGRAEQDGDLIESDGVFVQCSRGPTPARCRSAALRLASAAGAENPPDDFDAFAPLAWRRKPDQLSAALTFRRRLRRKQMTRKPREIGVAVRMECLDRDAAFLELLDSPRVAARDRDQHV